MDHYLIPAFSELYKEDGLIVMGRGLGVERLFAKFVQLYSARPRVDNPQPERPARGKSGEASKTPRKLVMCLNAMEVAANIEELLLSEHCTPMDLPKIINNEVSSQRRAELYGQGGCFFITSRILIVDLLDGKLDPLRIAGFLVYNAHRISEVSVESFIIRVYREKNRVKEHMTTTTRTIPAEYDTANGSAPAAPAEAGGGFLKAFSEDPESLQSGFGKVDRLMRLLYVKKLYLWPRIRLEVAQFIENRPQPEVIELAQKMTGNMEKIQKAILIAMNTCLHELKRAAPSIDAAGASFTDAPAVATSAGGSDSKHINNNGGMLSLENSLFQNFDYFVRSQLDPEWHRTPFRTKQLVSDLSTLRKLLDYLVRYDAFSLYYLLLKLKSTSSEQSYPSLWLTTAAADEIFRYAKERVYSTISIENRLQEERNSEHVAHNEVEYSGGNESNSESSVRAQGLLSFSDAGQRKESFETVEQRGNGEIEPNVSYIDHKKDLLHGFLRAVQSTLHLDSCIVPTLECPPKWQLLLDVVREIKDEYYASTDQSTEDSYHGSSSDSSGKEYKVPTRKSRYRNGRVLLIARDEIALTQIRDILCCDGNENGRFGTANKNQYNGGSSSSASSKKDAVSSVMESRYRWFISQQAASIRSRARARAAAVAAASAAARSGRPVMRVKSKFANKTIFSSSSRSHQQSNGERSAEGGRGGRGGRGVGERGGGRAGSGRRRGESGDGEAVDVMGLAVAAVESMHGPGRDNDNFGSIDVEDDDDGMYSMYDMTESSSSLRARQNGPSADSLPSVCKQKGQIYSYDIYNGDGCDDDAEDLNTSSSWTFPLQGSGKQSSDQETGTSMNAARVAIDTGNRHTECLSDVLMRFNAAAQRTGFTGSFDRIAGNMSGIGVGFGRDIGFAGGIASSAGGGRGVGGGVAGVYGVSYKSVPGSSRSASVGGHHLTEAQIMERMEDAKVEALLGFPIRKRDFESLPLEHKLILVEERVLRLLSMEEERERRLFKNEQSRCGVENKKRPISSLAPPSSISISTSSTTSFSVAVSNSVIDFPGGKNRKSASTSVVDLQQSTLVDKPRDSVEAVSAGGPTDSTLVALSTGTNQAREGDRLSIINKTEDTASGSAPSCDVVHSDTSKAAAAATEKVPHESAMETKLSARVIDLTEADDHDSDYQTLSVNQNSDNNSATSTGSNNNNNNNSHNNNNSTSNHNNTNQSDRRGMLVKEKNSHVAPTVKNTLDRSEEELAEREGDASYRQWALQQQREKRVEQQERANNNKRRKLHRVSDRNPLGFGSIPGTDSKDVRNVEQEAKEEREEEEDEALASSLRCFCNEDDDFLRGALLDPELHIELMTQATAKENNFFSQVLSDIQPSVVILCDPDVYLVRNIEAHQARMVAPLPAQPSSSSSPSSAGGGSDGGEIATAPMKVYFLLYDGSVEEHRYVASLAKEKKAFETLIRAKEHLVISLPDNPFDLEREHASDAMLTLDTRSTNKSLYDIHREDDISAHVVAAVRSADGVEVPLGERKVVNSSSSSSSKKPLPPSVRKIVVDVREFRSTLPSLLHAPSSLSSSSLSAYANQTAGYGTSSAMLLDSRGSGSGSRGGGERGNGGSESGIRRFQIVPRTLTVGDYVLSPEICVERKGISDLFQSFASGRLFNQAESMCKYYKHPCLLIEFSPDKSFSLTHDRELTSEIQKGSIVSKIALLTMSFPRLRILWSRSAVQTTEIFKSLVHKHAVVDVGKAVSVGNILGVGASSSLKAKERASKEKKDNKLGQTDTAEEEVVVDGGDQEESAPGEEEVDASGGGDYENDALTTAREILLSLPGINPHNYRGVMTSVSNLAELGRLSEKKLSTLIGPGNAKKLAAFFHQRVF